MRDGQFPVEIGDPGQSRSDEDRALTLPEMGGQGEDPPVPKGVGGEEDPGSSLEKVVFRPRGIDVGGAADVVEDGQLPAPAAEEQDQIGVVADDGSPIAADEGAEDLGGKTLGRRQEGLRGGAGEGEFGRIGRDEKARQLPGRGLQKLLGGISGAGTGHLFREGHPGKAEPSVLKENGGAPPAQEKALDGAVLPPSHFVDDGLEKAQRQAPNLWYHKG